VNTDYLSPKARHDRHRYVRAEAALHRLLGEELAEAVLEGHVELTALTPVNQRAAQQGFTT
jgi:hypothetical protein